MAQGSNRRQSSNTGFQYYLNNAAQTATIGFNGKQYGYLWLPYLNMNIEASIDFLREVKEAYIRYNRAVSNGH